MAQLVPALQQVVTTLTSLVTSLSAKLGSAQAQAGATGVMGESGAGAPVEGGGAGPVQQAPSGGCGCGGMADAQGAAGAPSKGAKGAKGGVDAPKLDEHVSEHKKSKSSKKSSGAPTPPTSSAPATGGGAIDGQGLTVKGKALNAEQREMAERVLKVGQQMGANKKVLETAVSTMIQESTLTNLKHGDRDSQGLFQQRPSQGWGTVAQVTNPEHAARKFFEKAIPNDRKNPGQAKTALAQSVQISGFPNAYAQWDKEAEKIVADFLG